MFFTGCRPKEEAGFAIYLTEAQTVPVEDMRGDLSKVELEDKPIIGMEDILFYEPATHQISLSQEAAKRVGALNVPISGRTFVVCLDSEPVYGGAFFTPLSSGSYSGVVILHSLEPVMNKIEISLGYPSLVEYRGEDPRPNQALMDALEKAGIITQTTQEATP